MRKCPPCISSTTTPSVRAGSRLASNANGPVTPVVLTFVSASRMCAEVPSPEASIAAPRMCAASYAWAANWSGGLPAALV